ncbi:hypothetical protein CN914_28765 [Bacillus thuringiensis]|nr:hypothetical protein CN914_28765 [Bacillus thuringiensis]
MNYMDTYQYTEMYANKLEIPKYCIGFLFTHLIVRKIGISCEVYMLTLHPSLCSRNIIYYFIPKYFCSKYFTLYKTTMIM